VVTERYGDLPSLSLPVDVYIELLVALGVALAGSVSVIGNFTPLHSAGEHPSRLVVVAVVVAAAPDRNARTHSRLLQLQLLLVVLQCWWGCVSSAARHVCGPTVAPPLSSLACPDSPAALSTSCWRRG
jgi:hypothetical protein